MATANAAAAFVTAINQPGYANGDTIRSLNKIDVFYREGGVICDYNPDRTTYDCDMLNVIKNNTGQILIDTSPTTQAIRNLLSSSSAIITFSAPAPPTAAAGSSTTAAAPPTASWTAISALTGTRTAAALNAARQIPAAFLFELKTEVASALAIAKAAFLSSHAGSGAPPATTLGTAMLSAETLAAAFAALPAAAAPTSIAASDEQRKHKLGPHPPSLFSEFPSVLHGLGNETKQELAHAYNTITSSQFRDLSGGMLDLPIYTSRPELQASLTKHFGVILPKLFDTYGLAIASTYDQRKRRALHLSLLPNSTKPMESPIGTLDMELLTTVKDEHTGAFRATATPRTTTAASYSSGPTRTFHNTASASHPYTTDVFSRIQLPAAAPAMANPRIQTAMPMYGNTSFVPGPPPGMPPASSQQRPAGQGYGAPCHKFCSGTCHGNCGRIHFCHACNSRWDAHNACPNGHRGDACIGGDFAAAQAAAKEYGNQMRASRGTGSRGLQPPR